MDVLYMECRPLGINITLVVAGVVKSNIMKNAIRPGIVPENTFYPTYASQILNLASGTQADAYITPVQEFAEQVARGTTVKDPPRFMLLGRGSMLFWLLSWLPRAWTLTLMWWLVSKM